MGRGAESPYNDISNGEEPCEMNSIPKSQDRTESGKRSGEI